MKKKSVLFFVIFVLSSCAIDPYTNESKMSNTAKGGLIGAAAGAGIGALAKCTGKNKKNCGKAVAIGAGSGGIAGMGVGAYFDIQAKKLRQELQGSGVSVKKVGNKINLVMAGNITFKTGTSTLQDNFKATLNSVAKVLKEYNETNVEVVGYTDNTGSEATNKQLSLDRANVVSNYLKGEGVSNNRFIIKGLGSSNPIASNSSANGREKNRRVEINLTERKQ
jgi:outer membrane protein OmpA-like peptidoglycan-associated protein